MSKYRLPHRGAVNRGARAPRRAGLLGLACCSVLPAAALAQSAAPTPQLPPVVVTATRTEAQAYDTPAAIDRIGSDAIRGVNAQVNISESLGSVPGLLARDRQNYAQDVQISVRGFGARTPFGIRGVRLYVDGIPATFPDGQGQITNVDLGSVDRIEVLRGPSSALYGNSSGGVIQVFTEDGAPTPTLDFGFAAGSNGVLRANTKLSGNTGAIGYVLSASHFETDGYRDHSAAERNIGNAKLTLRLDDASTLTMIANSVEIPQAQDPLGLDRKTFEAAPRSVAQPALDFNTRKNVDQTQAGLIWERRLDAANSLRAMVYTGHRNTEQYQSIPVASQGSPLHPGGVIVLGTTYQGTDLRWTLRGRLADAPYTLVAGLAADTVDQRRQGYQNFTGTAPNHVLGVKGALRRDENDTATDVDQYLQALWQFAPGWTLSAGLRHSSVRIESVDHYITGANHDDSGATRYGKTLPALGLMYAVNDAVHVYASAGRGLETPTLNELAYRPNNASGLNFALQPATSTSAEVGMKTRLAGVGELNAAVFQTRTEHEIVTLSNTSGRSVYQNAGATRRRGLELAWSASYLENLRAQAALTLLDATYRDPFTACYAPSCSAATQLPVAAGNRMPGVPRTSLYAALGWQPANGWRAGVEGRYLGAVYVNDTNVDPNAPATPTAPAYFIASVNAGYAASYGPWRLSGFVRSDNLFDRHYAGSIIVNEGNGRYFEPAPGRTWLAGAAATLSF